MSEWKIVKLGDILNLITKGTTPPKGVGFVNKGINYIKSDAIGYDRKLDKSKIVQIDELTHQKFKRSQLVENDILYSMAGIYLGKNAIVSKEILPANTNQALAILRINQNLANPDFVSFFLSQKNMIDFVNNMSGQSAQPNINFEEIKSIEITLPPLPEQKAIATILSSLDDKIDLLLRQNATLEKMAETLFRQWFVEEVKEDWEEKNLNEFGYIICGKTPSKRVHSYFGGSIPFIKIPDMHGKTFIFDTEDKLTMEGANSQVKKFLPPMSICVSCIATVGLVSMNVLPSQSNQQINSIIPHKEIYRFFLFLKMKSMKNELLTMASGGTATDNLNTGDFSKICISYPGLIVLEEFHAVVKPLFEKIFANAKQIYTLTLLRDAMLPKLMNGEIKVNL